MDGFASEHLILLVAAVVVLNRGFDSTGLRLHRWAFVTVQAFDLAMVGILFVARIPELPPKADFVIRIFLMLFVAYHMVTNSQTRGRALSSTDEEEDRQEERRARLARAAGLDPQTGADASDPESDEAAADL